MCVRLQAQLRALGCVFVPRTRRATRLTGPHAGTAHATFRSLAGRARAGAASGPHVHKAAASRARTLPARPPARIRSLAPAGRRASARRTRSRPGPAQARWGGGKVRNSRRSRNANVRRLSRRCRAPVPLGGPGRLVRGSAARLAPAPPPPAQQAVWRTRIQGANDVGYRAGARALCGAGAWMLGRPAARHKFRLWELPPPLCGAIRL